MMKRCRKSRRSSGDSESLTNGSKSPSDSSSQTDASTHLDQSQVLAPCNYISSLPSKGFRGALIDALDVWLHVPASAATTVKDIAAELHNSSLILDDIEDDSSLRRGQPSAHVVFGKPQAINSATFMYVRAVRLAQTLHSEAATEALLYELAGLFVGQSWDLYWKHHLRVPTEEEYLEMIDMKTGGLFRLIARLMLSVSTIQPRADVARTEDTGAAPAPGDAWFDRLFRLVGRFFQVRDDYMNLASTVYSKQKGWCEDLDEGKLSYLVVHCCTSQPMLRDHILGLFRSNQQGGGMSDEGKHYVLGCLEKSGSMEATRAFLVEMEDSIEEETVRLEQLFGEENAMIRLLMGSVSIKSAQKS